MPRLPSTLGFTAIAAAIAVSVRTTDEHFAPDLPPDQSMAIAASTRPAPSPESGRPHADVEEVHRDLKSLARTLALSHRQQCQIHPTLLRSRPDYDPALAYSVTGFDSPQRLGPPLGRADFEDILFAILDGEQQLDYAAAATESEAWWRSVIARLEADLEKETTPPEPSGPSSHRDRKITLPPPVD